MQNMQCMQSTNKKATVPRSFASGFLQKNIPPQHSPIHIDYSPLIIIYNMQKKNLCYKSDFKITEKCDAGYAMRFRFLYYVGSPSKAYMASYDGETFTNCHLNEDGTLTVCFDDHGLGIGDLMVERRYYFNDEQYQSGVCDVVIPAAPVVVIDKDAPQLSKLFAVVLSTKGLSYLECYAIVEPYWMYGGFGEAAYANEEERKDAEASRVIAENNRVLAENKRENDWTSWFTDTKNTFASWFKDTKTEVSTWFTSAKNEVKTWFEGAKSQWTTWYNSTTGAWTSWFTDAKNAWTSWFDARKSEWTTWFNSTKAEWTSLKSTVETWFSDTKGAWASWYNTTTGAWTKWFNDTKSAWSTWSEGEQSAWASWLTSTKNAWTSWFNATKSEWTTLKADATAATNAANTAKTAADTATTNANAAAARCETATTSANKATSDANAAAAVALSAADTAKSEAQNARVIANDASNVNQQSKQLVAEMSEGLEAQQIATAAAETAAASAQAAAALASKAGNSPMIRPSGLFVSVPKVVPIGGVADVKVEMLPESCYASKVFQSWTGCRVAPDGQAEFTDAGTAVFYVIPTLNDTIAMRVEVTVRELENLQAEDGTEITTEDGISIAI